MSFLTKIVSLNFNFKCLSPFSYMCKEVRLRPIQYYSVTNVGILKREKLKFDTIGVRRYSIMTSFFHNFNTLKEVFSDIFKGRFNYIPVLGSGKFKLSGYLWYETLDDVPVDEFFTLFELPDTYYSRCKVIELHVWMLLFCLPQDCRVHNVIRYAFIQAMWQDFQNRAKLVAKNNIDFKKDMAELYEEFKVSLIMYDMGIYKNDVVLASALWYCFFGRRNVDPRLLEALVYFVRHQLKSLEKIDMTKLRNMKEMEGKDGKPRIWISPRPFVENIKST